MAAEFKIGRLRFTWLGPWQPNTTYIKDAIVSYQGKTYVCLIANTSNSTNFYSDLFYVTGSGASTPFWNLIIDGKTFTGPWTTGTYYNLGNIAIFGGQLYYCTTQHSATAFANQSAFWSKYTQFPNWHITWTTNTIYGIGDVVKYGATVYQCVTNHTSAPTTALGIEANQSAWTIFYSGLNFTGNWIANTRYKVNDLVKQGADLYICTTYNTDSTFIPAKWALWMPGYQFAGIWNSSTIYQPGDIVEYGGLQYTSNTSNNTNNTPSTDTTNWKQVSQGFNIRGEWNNSTNYKVYDVVRRHGILYLATVDNNTTGLLPQDPSVISIQPTYISYGSSGSTINVSSTIGIVAGMNVVGTGFTGAQTAISTSSAAASSTSSTISGGTSLSIGGTVTGTFSLGMLVSGTGISPGTYIASGTSPNFTLSKSATNATITDLTGAVSSVKLSQAPDGTPVNGQSLTFTGVNYLYWSILVPGTFWTKTWISGTTTGSGLFQTVVPTQYIVGDLVVWQNTTYVCIQTHTASISFTGTVATSGNRPDLDTTNTYWVIYVTHARKNAMNTIGDLEYYSTTTNSYTALPIGSSQYVLRNTGGVPTWTKINAVSAVYYVSTSTGQDIPTYGSTWDQPWKTIKYACNFIGAGTLYPNTVALLAANKTWLTTEMVQWAKYQISNNLSPYSTSYTLDAVKAARDAGYIIDALIYDIARGGNSQTVAATQSYFAFGSSNTYYNSAVQADVPYYLPMLNRLLTLLTNVISEITLSPTYQSITGSKPVYYQNATLPLAEAGGLGQATTLMNIIITALTNNNTNLVPAANSGLTATIFVKTGTYAESLPITVPENVAIVGDELRGVVVEPANVLLTNCTATTSAGNLITVVSSTGKLGTTILADQVPVQFVAPNISTSQIYATFGGLVAGTNYYVVGNTLTPAINPTSFSVTTSTGSYSYVASTVVTSISGSGATFNVVPASDGTYTVSIAYGGSGYGSGDVIKISGTNIGAATPTNDVTITVTNQTNGLITAISSVGSTIFPVTIGSGTISGGTAMTVYAGDCIKDMFRLRNGTGMRNMTLIGLLGSLSLPDSYIVQRPTGGSYACLDPGTGPNDTTAWIFRRSPYVQNVTAFGNGCTGLKIDGTLHNGGNKSIVCNDFTHIISDGIGIWCTGPSALTEAVSVFSYYGYTGYFAEAGGRIRATNGNTSYGTYGVIASGYDVTEVPATGIIFNQSTQVQATVQQAFGSQAQLLRLNYSNAGSAYFTTTTNLLNYSNNFVAASWVNDGNLILTKTSVALTGITEAWTITGASSGANSSYLYQNITIPTAGATFNGLSATNITGTGGTGINTPATFNITVTSTGYSVLINNGGSGYANTNTMYIDGSQLGGVSNVNNLTITVTGVAGSSISQVSVTGAVPINSWQNYTCSIFVKQGSAASIDLYGIFSGSASVSSSINFNFTTGIVTPNLNGALPGTSTGFTPIAYGVVNQQLSTTDSTAGWYRLWFTLNDTTGLNTQLQFRIYPRGYNGTINTFTYFYGSQTELSQVITNTQPVLWSASTAVALNQYLTYSGNIYQVYVAGITGTTAPSGTLSTTNGTASLNYIGSYVPSFYLEVANISKFTAYANFNITGSGVGVVTVADEIRSQSVFQTRVITDTSGITGGAGYLTASNNAQGGTTQYIILSQSDVNTNANYTGMRVFINSGTGAGQYGYISYYNTTNKFLYVLKESFTSLQVASTNSGTGYFTLNVANTTSSLYLNQPVQFIPTYYNTSVTATSLSQITATATIGGTTNTITVSSTLGLSVNTAILFTAGSGAIFGGVTAGYYYYIYAINPVINGSPTTNTIQVTNSPFGTLWQLSTVATGSMVINFSSNTGYLTASTTNMFQNYPIQFTGTAIGGLTVGTNYYINDIVNSNNFTVSSSLVTVSILSSSSSYNSFSVASSINLVPLNPIIFTGTAIGGVTLNTPYYIVSFPDVSSFCIGSLITTTATATSNLGFITVGDTTGFVQNQPIIFTGASFDPSIVSETTYYIGVINSVGPGGTFTITNQPGGQPISLIGGIGILTVKTGSTPQSIVTSPTGGMTGTSTSKKTLVSYGQGTMTATFSTQLFGNPVLGTTYYIQSIFSSSQFAVSSTTGTVSGASTSATPLTLLTRAGSMNLAAVGWDSINPLVPPVSVLDNSSVYFIEPKTTYTAPPFNTSTGVISTPLASGTSFSSIAYGNNYWIAMPNNNATAAGSRDGSNWSSITLPSTQTWAGIAYGNGYWVIIAGVSTASTVAAISKSNGQGWKSITLPVSATWSNIAYGNGTFVSIATGSNTGIYSTSYGQSWVTVQTATTLTSSAITNISVSAGTATVTFNSQPFAPFIAGSTITLTGFNPSSTTGTVNNINSTFTVGTCNQTTLTFALTGSYSSISFGTISGFQSGLPSSSTWTGLTYGNGRFVAVASGGTTAIYSTDGIIWRTSTLPASTTWSSITYGQSAFVAVSSTSSVTAYSADGITWNSSNTAIAANFVTYGQGLFVALSASGAVYTTESVDWTTQTSLSNTYGCLGFGFSSTIYTGYFLALGGQTTATLISAGCRAKGRVSLTSGTITGINGFETGSGYSALPSVTFTDPNVTTLAVVTPRTANGVLSSPSFNNRGNGYNSNSTITLTTGNGYSDQYQTGLTVILNNLTRIPSPGDNLIINGISQIYKVTSAYGVYNTVAPNLEANVSVSPAITTANSTANGTSISIRSKYSQARLTNHDFLNIGYGDFLNSNYPGFPASGYVSTPSNQTVEINYGRVFFTSTDQDGNFKVGNLFGVQQATGIITLSASQFGLSGLNSLSLGGISVGGSSVIINQFSTDGSFTANSDYVLPTQKAVKSYITSRLSQGGANTFTGQLTAGTVVVGGAYYIKSTVTAGSPGSTVKMANKVNIAVVPGTGVNPAVGVDGNMAALNFFARNAFRRS